MSGGGIEGFDPRSVKGGDNFVLAPGSTGTIKPPWEQVRSALMQITPRYFIFIHFYSCFSSEGAESAPAKPTHKKALASLRQKWRQVAEGWKIWTSHPQDKKKLVQFSFPSYKAQIPPVLHTREFTAWRTPGFAVFWGSRRRNRLFLLEKQERIERAAAGNAPEAEACDKETFRSTWEATKSSPRQAPASSSAFLGTTEESPVSREHRNTNPVVFVPKLKL